MKLASLEQEYAHQLNRRTEFQVISTNFVPSETPVDGEGEYIDDENGGNE
jgi:hypothetical protein